MTRDFSFHEIAGHEILEITAFYSAENPELAHAFLDEVDVVIHQILEYPEAAPLVNRLVRRKVLRRFPYSIMYSVAPEMIRILAIAHQKRRPFYWRGRR